MVHDGWGPLWSGGATLVAPPERTGPGHEGPAARTPHRRATSRRLRRRLAVATGVVLVAVLAWSAWLVTDVLRARAALESLARTNAVNHWQFNEWFHGLTGEPMGMPGQSWNAASFLLAAASLEGKVFVDGNAKAPVKRHR